MGLSQKLIAIGLLLCEAQSNREKSHRSQDVGRITPDILLQCSARSGCGIPS